MYDGDDVPCLFVSWMACREGPCEMWLGAMGMVLRIENGSDGIWAGSPDYRF